MSTRSSPIENIRSHRQGSITSLPDDDDEQKTIATDSLAMPSSSSPSYLSSVKIPDLHEVSPFYLRQQSPLSDPEDQAQLETTAADASTTSWNLSSMNDNRFPLPSQSDSSEAGTTSFGFQLTNQMETAAGTTAGRVDYAALLQSGQLYFDPNPEIIRKPAMIAPIIYKQNITIKFLKPPSIPQAPLIIREIRPPQPPPPPPLVELSRLPLLISFQFHRLFVNVLPLHSRHLLWSFARNLHQCPAPHQVTEMISLSRNESTSIVH